jgi:hypothetical protein
MLILLNCEMSGLKHISVLFTTRLYCHESDEMAQFARGGYKGGKSMVKRAGADLSALHPPRKLFKSCLLD